MSLRPQPFEKLLDETKGCECTDLVDRIHAVLNLCPSMKGLQLDYTQESQGVFQDVVRLLTKKTRTESSRPLPVV